MTQEDYNKNALSTIQTTLSQYPILAEKIENEMYNRLVSAGGDITEKLDIHAEAVPLAEELLAMGCKVVLIKCGTAGLYYRTADTQTVRRIGKRLELNTAAWADQEGLQPAFRADVVRSATGAGETCIAAYLTAVLAGNTSIAAFLAAVLSGRDPASCIALASAEGACCVTAYDALSGLLPIAELEARIRDGWQMI